MHRLLFLPFYRPPLAFIKPKVLTPLPRAGILPAMVEGAREGEKGNFANFADFA